MSKNSSAEKRSHDSEAPGSSQANQDSQQTGTSNDATARDGSEPDRKRRATSGGLMPDGNQPIPPLGERATLQEIVVSILGPAASTRGVQKSVDKLNKLGTELKVKAFLKDLKEADERSRENGAKWLKVFCDQICVKGCADKTILTPNVVLTWIIQRPDLFDIEALERLIRHCTSGNFPYIPAQNENQALVEENTEENNEQGDSTPPDEGKNIQDPEEKNSQDAPGNGEEAQQKQDVPSKDGEQAEAKGQQNDEDPYGAGPSHRLRPIPKPVGIGIKIPSTDYRKGPSRVVLSSPGKISPHSDDNSDIELQDDDTVGYLSGSEPEIDVLDVDIDSGSDTETVDITEMVDIESEP